MIIRPTRKSKDTLWISYPVSSPVFSEADISYVLMQYINENKESFEIVNEIADIFQSLLMLKKGRTNEVVCEGREIFEEILQEH